MIEEMRRDIRSELASWGFNKYFKPRDGKEASLIRVHAILKSGGYGQGRGALEMLLNEAGLCVVTKVFEKDGRRIDYRAVKGIALTPEAKWVGSTEENREFLEMLAGHKGEEAYRELVGAPLNESSSFSRAEGVASAFPIGSRVRVVSTGASEEVAGVRLTGEVITENGEYNANALMAL